MFSSALGRIWPGRPGMGLLAVGLWGCATGMLVGAEEKGDSPWKKYEGPLGVSVEVPEGWRVEVDSQQGWVEITGTAGERAFILPFFVAGPLAEEGGAAILRALCQKQMPAAEWREPQRIGQQAVRIAGSSEGTAIAGAVLWVVTPQGSAGTFYLTSAPRPRYPQAREAFVRLLKSLQIKGSPLEGESKLAVSLPEFVPWEDPQEKAFRLQVPKGWQVSGGLFRYASVDIRFEVVAVSPDEKIIIRLGDHEVPPFIEPNPTLAFSGFPEGSLYSPRYGVVRWGNG